jgi:hypothetical protein
LYGTGPVLSGGAILFKQLVPVVINGPLAQQWQGAENLEVYRAGEAQQIMVTLAQLATRCAASV